MSRLSRYARSRVLVACIGALVLAPVARAQLHAAIEHEDEQRADPADARDADKSAADAGVPRPVDASDATRHVPPPAPAQTMPAMPATAMVDVMGMDDDAAFGMFTLDRFERVKTGDGYATDWNAEGWLGPDLDKLWFKSEGRRARGDIEEADVQLLWNHAAAAYWNTQFGLRHDVGHGPDRTWAAFGIEGLAPYWFNLSLTAYLGPQGRTALRLEGSHDLLLTQRLVVQSRLELNAYGRSDPARDAAAGVSDLEAGVRLRYEIRREFAPYVGVEWHRRFASAANGWPEPGARAVDTQAVAGLRLWF